MDAVPLIHIGYHKTGTTWLQRELFGADSPVFFPLARGGSPKELGDLFVYDRAGQLLSPFRSNRAEVRRRVESILAERPREQRIPVISSERLSGNPHAGGFDARAIADRLAESFPSARILIVLREQRSMLLATYFQYLKKGGTDSLRDYATRSYDGRRPGFALSQLDYVDLVCHYRERFGPENVLVLPYELFARDPSAFVGRIGKLVSADVPTQGLGFDRVHNRGRNRVAESRLRVLNLLSHSGSVNGYSPLATRALRPAVRAAKRVTAKLVSGARHDAFVRSLQEEIAALTGDRYAAGNRRLAECTGLDLSAFGYDCAPP